MEFLKKLNVWQKRGLAAVLGGVAGYAYYYYIGCMSGTCAITSNPYISTGYGMLIGALLIDKPKTTPQETNNGNDSSAAGQKV
jgi:phage shock protein E